MFSRVSSQRSNHLGGGVPFAVDASTSLAIYLLDHQSAHALLLLFLQTALNLPGKYFSLFSSLFTRALDGAKGSPFGQLQFVRLACNYRGLHILRLDDGSTTGGVKGAKSLLIFSWFNGVGTAYASISQARSAKLCSCMGQQNRYGI